MDLIKKQVSDRKITIDILKNKLALLEKKQVEDLVILHQHPEYRLNHNKKIISLYESDITKNIVELSYETRGS